MVIRNLEEGTSRPQQGLSEKWLCFVVVLMMATVNLWVTMGTNAALTARSKSPSEPFVDLVALPTVGTFLSNGTALESSEASPEELLLRNDFEARAGKATVFPHKIPHRSIFIHTLYQSPEEMEPLLYENILNTHRIFAESWNESETAPLWFLREQDCLLAVQLAEPLLVPHFLNETRGNNKANLCRVAALYLKGGYYFDVDMGTIQAVPLSAETTFATPQEYQEPKNTGIRGLFNSFLAAAPGHPVLRKNLDIFLEHYRGEDLPLRSKIHHMGTGTLRLAWDQVSEAERSNAYMELTEKREPWKIGYPELKGTNKGVGCCCDFFVEDPDQQTAHFWSRIPGSGSLCKLPMDSNRNHKVKAAEGFQKMVQARTPIRPTKPGG